MKRSLKDYLLILLKGMGMGAADVVPGVSGGTIAFISGIYEELIYSIRSVNFKAFKLLLEGKFKSFAKAINLPFLMALVTGIGISILSLSKLMTFLLDNYSILTWSFFFGLIVASAWLVSKKITKWNVLTFCFLILGTLMAYAITELTPTATPDDLWFIFLCGMLAICAMILPGISGAFILLMLGKYAYILGAIDRFDLKVLMVFMGGAGIGIVSFSNVLAYFLKNFHNATIAVLTGVMLGSLNKVWPWKQVVSTFLDRHGIEKPLIERNVLPTTYGDDNYLFGAILCMVLGFLLIVVLERVAIKEKSV